MLTALMLLTLASSTPAQHQQAAAALYRVLTTYEAYGVFRKPVGPDATPEQSTRSEGVLSLGSGFAVSSDGWLLTARHVVDPASNLSDLCTRLHRDWPLTVSLATVRFIVLYRDIAGHTYGEITALIPAPDNGADLCTDGVAYTRGLDTTSTARLREMDVRADLAAVKLDASGISFLHLASVAPPRWTDMFVIGYSDGDVRTTVIGSVARRCEETAGQCVAHGDGTETCPLVRVMRTTAAVQEGMSGSPQIADGHVIGITTMRATDMPIGFAVPSAYALSWYRHVRWSARWPVPAEICVPTPER